MENVPLNRITHVISYLYHKASTVGWHGIFIVDIVCGVIAAV